MHAEDYHTSFRLSSSSSKSDITHRARDTFICICELNNNVIALAECVCDTLYSLFPSCKTFFFFLISPHNCQSQKWKLEYVTWHLARGAQCVVRGLHHSLQQNSLFFLIVLLLSSPTANAQNILGTYSCCCRLLSNFLLTFSPPSMIN